MRFHSLSFYGRRGWKWERPLKAASVSYQTGATSCHPGLFSYPFDMPRSLVWPEWGTALFLGLFRDGLWGCCFTLHRHKVLQCALSTQTFHRNVISHSVPHACWMSHAVGGGIGLAGLCSGAAEEAAPECWSWCLCPTVTREGRLPHHVLTLLVFLFLPFTFTFKNCLSSPSLPEWVRRMGKSRS